MSSIDAAREYTALRAAYAEADAIAAWPDDRLFGTVPGVSAWAPAGHLFHVTRTNGLVYRTLARLGRGGGAAGGAPNPAGALVLGAGRMPRGRGVAPELTRPPDDLDRPTLAAALTRSREACAALEPSVHGYAALIGRFPHPVLGDLDAVEWLRFLHVHTAHHLAIIRDIDAARDA